MEVLIHTSVAGATISEPGSLLLHVKLRVHSCRGKETATARAEDSRISFVCRLSRLLFVARATASLLQLCADQ